MENKEGSGGRNWQSEQIGGGTVRGRKDPSAPAPILPVLLLDSKYQQNWLEGHYCLRDWIPACEATELDSLNESS